MRMTKAAEVSQHAIKVRSQVRLGDLLTNPRIYMMLAVFCSVFTALNAVGFWIPSLLRQVGVHQISDIGCISDAISLYTAIGIRLIR
ncbi:hypothetical protein LJ656_34620 [Paraburkholderia sp. MMS20-SJTR3]|uniref:MFS transporter n=1 Tax=Paraburkholderia sejongensis TaxID=2886946 RepID=A0ABS8K6A1_9BURK|nr:hypothetical protein [Paraburkholderia sp. MMS20-SJTR3]MCC8397673.1 hypothetical protein [Paraburkholderia sp. MMS20-SJTR3]